MQSTFAKNKKYILLSLIRPNIHPLQDTYSLTFNKRMKNLK